MNYPPPGYRPPPDGSKTLILILAIGGGVLLLGAGSCIVCVGLAAVAADGEDASASAPVTTTTVAAPPGPTTTTAAPTTPTTATAPPTGPTGGDDRGSARGQDTSSIDGRYACFQLRVIAGPNFTTKTQWVPGALPGFTIAQGSYSTASGAGTVSVSSDVVTFLGGGYAGWRGATSTNSTGFYLLFRGKDPANPQPGVSAKSGDYQCYRQK